VNLIVSELGALKTYVSREFYYIMADLIATYGWKHVETYELWSDQRPLKAKLLAWFGQLPEVMLFWGGYELLGPREAELRRVECLKCAFVDDLHTWNDTAKHQRHKGLSICDMIFATYAYALGEFHPDLAEDKQVVWIPHSASPDFMIDYNECPANSILLSGALHPLYPLRCQMKSLYDQGAYAIVFHPHPGYRCGYDYDNDCRVGRQHAKSINGFRAAFTDCLKYRYVVAKYFEIPATGALLLAEDAASEYLARLGFTDGEHYVGVSSQTLEEMIRYVLSEANHPQVDAIRRRGQELVWRDHKTADRARMIHEACTPRSAMGAKERPQ